MGWSVVMQKLTAGLAAPDLRQATTLLADTLSAQVNLVGLLLVNLAGPGGFAALALGGLVGRRFAKDDSGWWLGIGAGTMALSAPLWGAACIRHLVESINALSKVAVTDPSQRVSILSAAADRMMEGLESAWLLAMIILLLGALLALVGLVRLRASVQRPALALAVRRPGHHIGRSVAG